MTTKMILSLRLTASDGTGFNSIEVDSFEWAFEEQYGDEALALLKIAQREICKNITMNSLNQLRCLWTVGDEGQ